MPEEEADQLQAHGDSISIDMVPDAYRYVIRDGVPLLAVLGDNDIADRGW